MQFEPASRYWLCRLYLATSTLATALMALTNQYGMHNAAFSADGADGYLWTIFLGGLAATAVGDSVINDLLPSRFRFCVGLHYRHLILIGIAGGHVGLIAASYENFGANSVMLRYIMDASFAAAVAILDIMARYKSALHALKPHRNDEQPHLT